MSYQYSAALQVGIYEALIGSITLADLVGTNIYDAIPAGQLPDTFVLIGEEKVLDRSDITATARRHDFTISVASTAQGFSDAKIVASEVCNILEEAQIDLSTGALRNLQFRSARSRRDTSIVERRIDLIFRALIDEI